MLGRHKMTQTGTAKVVSCELWMGGALTNDTGIRRAKFDVILDVSPDDGTPTFRAETREWFSPARHPDPGDSLQVRCNPEKRTVEIDLSEDTRFNPMLSLRANDTKRKQLRDETLNAEPGTPAAGPGGGYGVIDDPELEGLVREAEERERGV